MESLYLLIPLSIILAFLMGYFFWWSTKNGQFDDLKGPAHRILMDNDDIVNEENEEETKQTINTQETTSEPEETSTQPTEQNTEEDQNK